MNTVSGRPPAGRAGQASPRAGSRLGHTVTIPDAARLNNAIALAARLHAGQTDKAGQPYILHPLRVMMNLYNEDMRIAAVLHDTVEDCGLTIDEVRYDFGDEVADAVEALTRRKGENYAAFIERCGRNRIARLVKVADLQDNMNLSRLANVTEEDLKRQVKYLRAKHRLVAIAMETRRADTPQSESVAKP